MKYIIRFSLIGILLFAFLSCEEDLLNKEHYKNVIYLKSDENNIFSYPHAMNDSITTGYITVGSAGSMPLKNDALISLKLDYEKLEEYNYRNFGNDSAKYIQLVPEERFLLPSFETHIKAGELSATSFMPIKLDVNGLSPDTTYMLPFSIKSSDSIEVNEKKNYVFYRVNLINKYSSASSRTYKMKGTKETVLGENQTVVSNITTNKTLLPLASNQVRLFPENIASSTVLKDIENKTIILVINDDNTVRIKPYKNIEIEQIKENLYDPEEKIFTLNYKYKLPGAQNWVTIFEMLTRIE